ncbi:hypothetical protein [Fuchsiella alkaliacetigena]|uniref:hypothetical protein n=1 Tax=Fuchsiella alkaliacetigena TaxID=957042 RepID=UPI002009DE2E|nr:hypothetical protein [Fuchsiella alkaliacetigena]MCK8825864.1 hypothetical protein [Fuchsiella alkaliacetigena]
MEDASISSNEWNIGGKVIVISTCIAFLSLFMTWTDIGIIRASGIESNGYLFLILYIYPFVKVLRNSEMKKILGIISSVLAILGSVFFILSNTIEIMGSFGNVSGGGAYLFLLASVILFFGVIKYKN